VDRIDSGLEAGVPVDLARECGPLLGGSVRNVVAVGVTATLEGVVQTEPVARFVRRVKPRLKFSKPAIFEPGIEANAMMTPSIDGWLS
jgi:hypothetical protein